MIAQFAATLALSTLGAVSPLSGNWVMHLYIGSRVFDDQVTVAPGPDGRLGGRLTVPGAFTADLEHVAVDYPRFTFEITADEGRGPFRVRYEGTLHPTNDIYVGFATVLGDNPELLGGFVGRRQPGERENR